MAEGFGLNNARWSVIEPLLPRLGDKPRVEDRWVINGILHRYRESLRRRSLVAAYCPHARRFSYSKRWSEKGIWQAPLAALAP